jgi:hypothetical protein
MECCSNNVAPSGCCQSSRVALVVPTVLDKGYSVCNCGGIFYRTIFAGGGGGSSSQKKVGCSASLSLEEGGWETPGILSWWHLQLNSLPLEVLPSFDLQSW